MAAVLIKIKGRAKRWARVYNGHRGIIGRARERESEERKKGRGMGQLTEALSRGNGRSCEFLNC